MSNQRIPPILHVAVWGLLLMTPLSFFIRDREFNIWQYLLACMGPLLLMVVFYVNYLWLTTRFFVKGEKRYFFLINVVMIVALGVFLHFWMVMTHSLFESDVHHRTPNGAETVLFILRDIFNLAVAATVATAIRLSMRWLHTEEARLAAEAAQSEAELKNLRNQISPHFLLNTLNNIYALTAMDAQRAQEAIQQLSGMMRHMLYENLQDEVELQDEVKFLQNYVNLMKIRLPQSTDVTFGVRFLPQQSAAATTHGGKGGKIAPLIFISLIENAFKHGISPTEPCFIHIAIEADDRQVTCDIENSNFPKTERDRSGHGIGLQQVQRRLDLAYPGKYLWERGPSEDGTVYRSTLTIYRTQL